MPPSFSVTSEPALQHPEIIRPHMPPPGLARLRYFRAAAALADRMRPRILALRNRHAGRRAFIIGNAPSVAEMDLGLLRNEISFAVNSTFRLYPRMGFVCPYTCFSDRVRWRETGAEMLRNSAGTEVLCCDEWEVPTPPDFYSEAELERVIVLNQLYRLPLWLHAMMPLRNRAGMFTYLGLRERKFSWDLTEGVCVAKSVIFMAAQVAAWMGCNQIILIGVEMNYSQPQAHFHDQKVWTPAQDYDREVKPWFEIFRRDMESRGVEFLNATPGGRVNELKRVRYEDLFK